VQYVKINQIIAEQIEQGMLAPGQKLPSERQLAESFDTTRVTLREALSLLEADGLIYREDRRGWFISYPRLRFSLEDNLDFIPLAQSQERQPSIDVLLRKTLLANKSASQLLGLGPFSEVHQINMVAQLEKRPVCYMTYWVSAQHFPEFLKEDFNQGVISRVIEHYGVDVVNLSYSVTTSALLGDVCQILHATPGTPAMIISRQFYNGKGDVLFAEVAHWRHNALRLEANIPQL
jgi:DNA-binding GntR family transcriptional regulator